MELTGGRTGLGSFGGSLSADETTEIDPLALLSRKEGRSRATRKVLNNLFRRSASATVRKVSCAYDRDEEGEDKDGTEEIVHDEEERVELRCVLSRLEVLARDPHGALHHCDPSLE